MEVSVGRLCPGAGSTLWQRKEIQYWTFTKQQPARESTVLNHSNKLAHSRPYTVNIPIVRYRLWQDQINIWGSDVHQLLVAWRNLIIQSSGHMNASQGTRCYEAWAMTCSEAPRNQDLPPVWYVETTYRLWFCLGVCGLTVVLTRCCVCLQQYRMLYVYVRLSPCLCFGVLRGAFMFPLKMASHSIGFELTCRSK